MLIATCVQGKLNLLLMDFIKNDTPEVPFICSLLVCFITVGFRRQSQSLLSFCRQESSLVWHHYIWFLHHVSYMQEIVSWQSELTNWYIKKRKLNCQKLESFQFHSEWENIQNHTFPACEDVILAHSYAALGHQAHKCVCLCVQIQYLYINLPCSSPRDAVIW